MKLTLDCSKFSLLYNKLIDYSAATLFPRRGISKKMSEWKINSEEKLFHDEERREKNLKNSKAVLKREKWEALARDLTHSWSIRLSLLVFGLRGYLNTRAGHRRRRQAGCFVVFSRGMVETGCPIHDTCSQTWKFFRGDHEARLSSLLISNQARLNNLADISWRH